MVIILMKLGKEMVNCWELDDKLPELQIHFLFFISHKGLKVTCNKYKE